MMKAISKRLILTFLFACGSAAMPVLAFAADDFCTSLDPLSSRLESAVADREKAYIDARIAQEETWAEAIARSDASIKDSRSVWDTKEREIFATLEGRATTTKEKEAVAAFRIDLDHAILDRRSEVDGALAAFRTGASDVLKQKDASADQAILDLKVAMQAALQDAKNGCDGGNDHTALRDGYVKALSAARADLSSKLDAAKASDASLRDLAGVRESAITKAVDDFNAAVNAALKKLKVGFPGA